MNTQQEAHPTHVIQTLDKFEKEIVKNTDCLLQTLIGSHTYFKTEEEWDRYDKLKKALETLISTLTH